LQIEIMQRPGAFVTVGKPVMSVWKDRSLSEETLCSLNACFATGISPTVNQNIEFVADQLVEIMARALSPGVNDPHTAITCVNWLQVGILHFTNHECLSLIADILPVGGNRDIIEKTIRDLKASS